MLATFIKTSLPRNLDARSFYFETIINEELLTYSPINQWSVQTAEFGELCNHWAVFITSETVSAYNCFITKDSLHKLTSPNQFLWNSNCDLTNYLKFVAGYGMAPSYKIEKQLVLAGIYPKFTKERYLRQIEISKISNAPKFADFWIVIGKYLSN